MEADNQDVKVRIIDHDSIDESGKKDCKDNVLFPIDYVKHLEI